MKCVHMHFWISSNIVLPFLLQHGAQCKDIFTGFQFQAKAKYQSKNMESNVI